MNGVANPSIGHFASGKDHYINYGFKEDRRYNQYCDANGPIGGQPRPDARPRSMPPLSPRPAPCPYNGQDYLDYNKDIFAGVQKGTFTSGLQHFINSGVNEIRISNRSCRQSFFRKCDGLGRFSSEPICV